MQKLIMIVAATAKGEIGIDGKLPWQLFGDLGRFRNLTEGKVVIMGRKTYESIGHMLPRRINIVVSKTGVDVEDDPNIMVVHSIEKAIEKARYYNTDIYFIGGAGIYEYALDVVDKVEWTIVLDRIDRQHLEYDTVIKNFTFPSAEWVCTRIEHAPLLELEGTDIPTPSHQWVTLERLR